MAPRLWLEPAGFLRSSGEGGMWRMSAYRVRGGPESHQILIAEDGATGRWGIVRGPSLHSSGDFASVEDALASLQDELNAGTPDEGSFE